MGGGAFCLHRDMSVNLEPLTICSVSVHCAMFDAKGSLSRKGGRASPHSAPCVQSSRERSRTLQDLEALNAATGAVQLD